MFSVKRFGGSPCAGGGVLLGWCGCGAVSAGAVAGSVCGSAFAVDVAALAYGCDVVCGPCHAVVAGECEVDEFAADPADGCGGGAAHACVLFAVSLVGVERVTCHCFPLEGC